MATAAVSKVLISPKGAVASMSSTDGTPSGRRTAIGGERPPSNGPESTRDAPNQARSDVPVRSPDAAGRESRPSRSRHQPNITSSTPSVTATASSPVGE